MCVIVPESFIFAKDYHHSQMFSRELETVDNLRKFSFADYPRYTVYSLFVSNLRLYLMIFMKRAKRKRKAHVKKNKENTINV